MSEDLDANYAKAYGNRAGFGKKPALVLIDFAHAYLFSIAVRPGAQGKGLGRKLIAPVLAACDRLGVPAYLENSNPANAGFYGSLGFVVCGEIRPTPDAPALLPMVREPRSA